MLFMQFTTIFRQFKYLKGEVGQDPRDLPLTTDLSKCLFFLQEFPFFTMTSFPIGFLMHLGGVVSARSVKLLDRIHNPGLTFIIIL